MCAESSQIQFFQLQSGLRLVLDPKTGRILGTINGSNQTVSGMTTGGTTVVRTTGPPGIRMPGTYS
jgi:hypothetical protein